MPRPSAHATAWLAPALDQPGFRERLSRIGDGAGTVVFTEVDEAAHAWLVAVLHQWLASHRDKRLWLLCDRPRHRERLADELALWGIPALVLPDPPDPAGPAEAPESNSERLGVLRRIAGGAPALPIASLAALHSPVPATADLLDAQCSLSTGTTIDPATFATTLTDHGYERVERVDGRGQFASRGGIVDVFPWEAAAPTADRVVR